MRVNAGRRLPSRAREKGKKEGDAAVAVDPDRWVPAGRERESVTGEMGCCRAGSAEDDAGPRLGWLSWLAFSIFFKPLFFSIFYFLKYK